VVGFYTELADVSASVVLNGELVDVLTWPELIESSAYIKRHFQSGAQVKSAYLFNPDFGMPQKASSCTNACWAELAACRNQCGDVFCRLECLDEHAICVDNCNTPPPADADGDGVADNQDNCPNTANANQADCDGDGIGNVCDSDNTTDSLISVNRVLVGYLPIRNECTKLWGETTPQQREYRYSTYSVTENRRRVNCVTGAVENYTTTYRQSIYCYYTSFFNNPCSDPNPVQIISWQICP